MAYRFRCTDTVISSQAQISAHRPNDRIPPSVIASPFSSVNNLPATTKASIRVMLYIIYDCCWSALFSPYWRCHAVIGNNCTNCVNISALPRCFGWKFGRQNYTFYNSALAPKITSNSAMAQRPRNESAILGGGSLWGQISGWRVTFCANIYGPSNRGMVHYNCAAGSFHAKKLCSRLYSIEVEFCLKNKK